MDGLGRVGLVGLDNWVGVGEIEVRWIGLGWDALGQGVWVGWNRMDYTQASMKSSTESSARDQPAFHARLHGCWLSALDHPQCFRNVEIVWQISRNFALTSGRMFRADSQSPSKYVKAVFLKRHNSTRPAWPRRVDLPSRARALKFSWVSMPTL